MPDLSDILSRATAGRRRAPGGNAPAQGTDRLTDVADFGANPGALRARAYTPPGLPPGAPLVVVLHGCTQTAAGYDHGAGWSRLADEAGFALLFPEQPRENNSNTCFNWFKPDDIQRGSGEAASIAAMTGAMIALHSLDPARVFVTGLSAGGAMANVMLATWPELFAGGAIIAGLPFGVAGNVGQAMEAMRGGRIEGGHALADHIRAASPHTGPWPTISVWHGMADAIVAPVNADAIIAQWAAVQGLSVAPDTTSTAGGVPRQVWLGEDGRARIEAYRIAGMGHGTPIATVGDEACGAAGPFFLDAGISSTRLIANFWGIAPRVGATRAAERPARSTRVLTPEPLKTAAEPARAAGVGSVIETALRGAGLMR